MAGLYVKDLGAWKLPKSIWVKNGGVWRVCSNLYVKSGGAWREMMKTVTISGSQTNFNLHNYVGRPSPLYLAKRLSEKYGAHIYLKREDLNHTGAHKINNTIGQILIAQKLGKTKIIAETGAGQHGVATATVCALMGLDCTVFMGEKDIVRQAPNVARMKMLGAKVVPATSGSKTLKDATNEAIRYWICLLYTSDAADE